jgi:pentose-5-phosphate-3-epimerase/CBS domain-containing protein
MKISASIYSDKRPLQETIEDLAKHRVDLLHVDCNDDVRVFDDIAQIRQWTNIPIDLHIITENPAKYFPLLRNQPVEYVTFQVEQLTERLELPADITGKKGIAIITPTDISVFDAYSDFDFILIMATIPGQSGGVFDKTNFTKIRQFKQRYPNKSIHVDGGVNAEVSFILRNMGVSSSVSGSYLFKAPSVGHALMELTMRATESHYQIDDFMIPLSESPVLEKSNLSFKHLLETIELGKLGFCVVVDENQKFLGMCSNADIRKGLLAQFDALPNLDADTLINKNPLTLTNTDSVVEMFQKIKISSFPVMYLPVVDADGNAKGIVTFVNLIKGEL